MYFVRSTEYISIPVVPLTEYKDSQCMDSILPDGDSSSGNHVHKNASNRITHKHPTKLGLDSTLFAPLLLPLSPPPPPTRIQCPYVLCYYYCRNNPSIAWSSLDDVMLLTYFLDVQVTRWPVTSSYPLCMHTRLLRSYGYIPLGYHTHSLSLSWCPSILRTRIVGE